MKAKLIIVMIAISVIAFKGYGQFSFGVNPGLNFNGANFGYKINDKIVPYVGFQFANINYEYERSGKEYDYELGEIVDYSRAYDMNTNVYLPSLGVKFFFLEKNKLHSYLNACVAVPFVTYEEDGDEYDYYDEFTRFNSWGAELGFGIEYFLDDNFSLGGEFGFRNLHLGYEEEHERYVYNPQTGFDEKYMMKYSYKYNINPTYTKLSMNFYF